jgi:hypothetical protein
MINDKMQTNKVSVEGGFHNVRPISLILKNNKMSVGQYKRLEKHLCPTNGCTCAGRGIEISGMSREVFLGAREDASYAAHYGNR